RHGCGTVEVWSVLVDSAGSTLAKIFVITPVNCARPIACMNACPTRLKSAESNRSKLKIYIKQLIKKYL
ncbi:MAG: hypothetical protein AAEI92_10715, partial [Arenicellales bacterium]